MWKQLTLEDVKLVLCQDEIEKLENLSKDPSSLTIIQNTIDMICDTWRGALRGKSIILSSISHSIPAEYAVYILHHIRYTLWTRFPDSIDMGLDARRVKEYEEALSMLSSMSLGVESPALSDITENLSSETGSIYVPHQRTVPYPWLDPWYFNKKINEKY